jgi:prepilin-type N-terminal cleavage/methylation domain-containing protein
MATRSPLPLPLARWLLNHPRASRSRLGFTLIELLVALIVGTLIIGSLLYFAVELLGVNAREERLTQVQQDMNRALKYIETDLREAAYIYADASTPAAELSDVANVGTPVLAFWRTEPIRLSDTSGSTNTLGPCSGQPNPAKVTECEVLRSRQVTYDLVIYFVSPNEAGGIWAGPNRLIRYHLPAYKDLGRLDFSNGYADPLVGGFADWESSGNTRGTMPVLVDSVDSHDSAFTVACPTGTTLSPANAATAGNHFFTCFPKSAIVGGVAQADAPKSLFVFLRGNFAQAGNSILTFGPAAAASRLPTLSTEVQARSVQGSVDPATRDR